MAWSYSAPNRNTGWSYGPDNIIWDNEWTVRELMPNLAGYIRLEIAVRTTHFEYWRNGISMGSYDGSADSVSYGGTTVSIRENTVITSAYSYTKEFYIPASWAGQTIRFNVAWRQVDVLCGASAAQPSTISASDGVLGQAVAISLNRSMGEVTHTLTVSCLGQSTTLLTNSSEVTASWTPAVATYAPLMSGKTCQATFSCESFYQGTSIGTETKTITLTLSAADGAPTGASGWAAASPYNTGAAAGMSGWIQGFSQAEVTFDASKITTRYGATVTGYSVTALGETDSTSPYRTPVLREQTQVQCTVTDSRGFTYTETLTITPQSYAPPALSSIQIFRCDSQGQADEDGNYCSVKATLSYSALNGENSCGLWASSKLRDASGYGPETAMQSAAALVLSGFDPDQSYEVRLRATDTLGGETTVVRTLMPRSWAMKFRPNGKGVAFGKAPTEANVLELGNGWNLKLNDANGNSVTLSYAQLVALLNLI